METLGTVISAVKGYVWDWGIPVGDSDIPLVVIALIGTGVFLTLRLGIIQLRHFGHGVAVATGRYDDPQSTGDVSHFQALTTALSATVGIGNIAGVALAIHWGGPGALVWMWLTAILGMATKYAEVTLSMHYRSVHQDADKVVGTVSGGPMYYIEHGLGANWKWMAMFFAGMLGFTAFLTGNAIQANTIADTLQTEVGINPWITGAVLAVIVASVILGGIKRIGRITSILAPLMAAIYVLCALLIVLLNFSDVIPAFGTIFREAFSPTAGVAGTGVGAILVTMTYGVNRGLFSNEAGQGSAPIAHAAAKTEEPVSEAVVALLGPFIDTIVICLMTATVLLITRPPELTDYWRANTAVYEAQTTVAQSTDADKKQNEERLEKKQALVDGTPWMDVDDLVRLYDDSKLNKDHATCGGGGADAEAAYVRAAQELQWQQVKNKAPDNYEALVAVMPALK